MYLKHSNLTEQIRESLRQIHEYQFKFRTRTVHNKYPSRFLVDQCPTTNVNQFNEHPNSFNEEYSNYLNCLIELSLKANLDWRIFLLALTEQIKDFFKKIYKNTKILVETFVEQHFDESIFIASRCLWNQENDRFCQFVFFNKTICIVILVFFISNE